MMYCIYYILYDFSNQIKSNLTQASVIIIDHHHHHRHNMGENKKNKKEMMVDETNITAGTEFSSRGIGSVDDGLALFVTNDTGDSRAV